MVIIYVEFIFVDVDVIIFIFCKIWFIGIDKGIECVCVNCLVVINFSFLEIFIEFCIDWFIFG